MSCNRILPSRYIMGIQLRNTIKIQLAQPDNILITMPAVQRGTKIRKYKRCPTVLKFGLVNLSSSITFTFCPRNTALLYLERVNTRSTLTWLSTLLYCKPAKLQVDTMQRKWNCKTCHISGEQRGPQVVQTNNKWLHPVLVTTAIQQYVTHSKF